MFIAVITLIAVLCSDTLEWYIVLVHWGDILRRYIAIEQHLRTKMHHKLQILHNYKYIYNYRPTCNKGSLLIVIEASGGYAEPFF